MNQSYFNSETQEKIWKIEPQSKKMKQPVLIKSLIEKAFDKLATKLIQRIQALENELNQMKAENHK